jgi:hypothetical protein
MRKIWNFAAIIPFLGPEAKTRSMRSDHPSRSATILPMAANTASICAAVGVPPWA